MVENEFYSFHPLDLTLDDRGRLSVDYEPGTRATRVPTAPLSELSLRSAGFEALLAKGGKVQDDPSVPLPIRRLNPDLLAAIQDRWYAMSQDKKGAAEPSI